jgi:peptide/nickel transport system permease protein
MFFTIIAKRLFIAVPTLLALTLAVFLMVKAIPGDPALMLLGERATPAALEEMRNELGLNDPLHTQYFRFLHNLIIEGDLGRSINSSEKISDIITSKFPATMELAIFAMIFAICIGIPSGLFAAIWPGTLIDFTSMSVAIAGVSMPIFWLAMVLTWIFGLELGWLPISQRVGIDFYYDPITGFILIDSLLTKEYDMFWDALKHLVLPAITLGTIPMAFLARITRAAMLEVLGQDFIRTAKAKGMSMYMVYLKHALKNAAIPLLTVLGLQFGLLLGGAIITETVFSWPGIGSWLLDSVNARDYPALEIGILVTAASFVVVNTIVDLLYSLFDPRVRVG